MSGKWKRPHIFLHVTFHSIVSYLYGTYINVPHEFLAYPNHQIIPQKMILPS